MWILCSSCPLGEPMMPLDVYATLAAAPGHWSRLLQAWLVSPAPVPVYYVALEQIYLLLCISVIISSYYNSLQEENKQVFGKRFVFSCFLSSLLFPPPLLQSQNSLGHPENLKYQGQGGMSYCFSKERKNICHFERQIFSFNLTFPPPPCPPPKT